MATKGASFSSLFLFSWIFQSPPVWAPDVCEQASTLDFDFCSQWRMPPMQKDKQKKIILLSASFSLRLKLLLFLLNGVNIDWCSANWILHEDLSFESLLVHFPLVRWKSDSCLPLGTKRDFWQLNLFHIFDSLSLSLSLRVETFNPQTVNEVFFKFKLNPEIWLLRINLNEVETLYWVNLSCQNYCIFHSI